MESKCHRKQNLDEFVSVGGLTPLLNRINLTSDEITSKIPFWHNYRYDGGSGGISMIRDGGGDMYDGGNKVSEMSLRHS